MHPEYCARFRLGESLGATFTSPLSVQTISATFLK